MVMDAIKKKSKLYSIFRVRKLQIDNFYLLLSIS